VINIHQQSAYSEHNKKYRQTILARIHTTCNAYVFLQQNETVAKNSTALVSLKCYYPGEIGIIHHSHLSELFMHQFHNSASSQNGKIKLIQDNHP